MPKSPEKNKAVEAATGKLSSGFRPIRGDGQRLYLDDLLRVSNRDNHSNGLLDDAGAGISKDDDLTKDLRSYSLQLTVIRIALCLSTENGYFWNPRRLLERSGRRLRRGARNSHFYIYY